MSGFLFAAQSAAADLCRDGLDCLAEWEINFCVGVGPTAATDHLIIKGIVGRRFSWGKRSPVD